MNIELIVVVGVVVVDIAYEICKFCSKRRQYDCGFKKGTNDYKKGYREKYQRYDFEKRQKGGDISTYKSSYIDCYNVASHRS